MTRNPKVLPDEELERLSAYLDGWLSKEEASRLEARLEMDKELSRALHEIRHTAGLLRSVPQVKPPRSFTLTPQMVGKPTRSWQYPILQLGTALATLAFLVVTGLSVLMRVGVTAAPAMSLARDVSEEAAAPPAEQPRLESAGQAPAASGTAAAEGAVPPESLGAGGAAAPEEETPFAGEGTPAPACAECPPPAFTQIPALPLEERSQPTAQPTLEPSPCAECEPKGTAVVGYLGDQALKAGPMTETPAIPGISEQVAEPPARHPVSLLGVLQAALGGSAVLLAVLTFRMRRRIR